MKKAVKKLFRLVRALLVGAVLLFFTALLVLRSPWIQNKLVPYAEDQLSAALGCRVEIGSVEFALPLRASIRGVVLYDDLDRIAISAGALKASLLDYHFWNLMLKKNQPQEFRVSHLWLDEPSVLLYRRNSDCKLNLSFLWEREKKTPSGKPMDLTIDVGSVIIQDGSFYFTDESERGADEFAAPGKIDFKHCLFRSLQMEAGIGYRTHGGKLNLRMGEFSVQELHSGFSLEEFTGKFELAMNGPGKKPDIAVKSLKLLSGSTRIDIDAAFYGSVNTLPDSIGNSPAVSACLRPTDFDFRFLNYFLKKELPLRGVVHLNGDFSGNLDSLFSPDVYLTTGKRTRLRTSVELLHLSHPAELQMNFDAKPSAFDFADLDSLLYKVNLPVKDTLLFSGLIKGDLEKWKSKNLLVKFGKNSVVPADARIYNYSKPEEMILDIKTKEAKVSIAELRRVVPAVSLPEGLNKIDAVRLDGIFTGGIRDFVVNASLISSIGRADGNLHLKLPPKVAKVTYEGWLQTYALNYDRLGLENGIKSSRMNFDGKIKGSGSKFASLDMLVSGKFTDSEFFGRTLDHLLVKDVTVKDKVIEGGMGLKDPEGYADVHVVLDLKSVPNSVNIQGDVKRIDLKHYTGYKDPLYLSSIVNVKLSGDSLENYTGRAKFFFISLWNKNRPDSIVFSDVIVRSFENSVDSKNLAIESSLLNMTMNGDFSFTEGNRLVSRMSKEIGLYIQNQDTAISRYYASKIKDTTNISINYDLYTRPELNPLFAYLGIPLSFSDQSHLKGSFTSLDLESVHADFRGDSLTVSGMKLTLPRASFDMHKDEMANSLIGSGDIVADEFMVNKQLKFQNVNFTPDFQDNVVNYELTAFQRELGNRFKLVAESKLLKNWVVTHLNPKSSYIKLRSSTWEVGKFNQITASAGAFDVEDLELINGQQRITLSGIASSAYSDSLHVDFSKVSIATIMEIFESDMGVNGELDGVRSTLTGLFSGPRIITKGDIKDFSWRKINDVDIYLESFVQTAGPLRFIGANTFWKYHGTQSLTLRGNYNLSMDSLNVISDSSTVPLVWAEPFVDSFIDNIQGTLTLENFNLRGNRRNVRMEGKAHLNGAATRVKMFNQMFYAAENAPIVFDREKVSFPSLNLASDTMGNSAATVSGHISYADSLLRFNLKAGSIRNFQVMNTSKTDNELFYGKAVLSSGTATITGTQENMFITADVTSGRDSRIDIPVSDYTSASRLDYVTFTGGGKAPDVRKTTNLKGYNLNLMVNATPDARVRLIFDEQVGDIIETYGEGAIRLAINEKGEFQMFGNYAVTEGDYLFTVKNVVNKEFKLERDGAIYWDGDPYDANLNLSATYRVNASLSTLLGPGVSDTRIPIDIVMMMTGKLSSPEIRLALRMAAASSDDVVGLASYFANIQRDEQELNRQVVSLLMFRRFAPTTSAGGEGGGPGGAFTSSLSELISNQLNYWLSQALSANLNVQLNTNEFEDVELGIRTTLFNDRVTVERNGAIMGKRTGGMSIGDITVTVKLLPQEEKDSLGNVSLDPYKGQLVLEIFNRENIGLNNSTNNTSGSGIFFKKDFDRLIDLFRSRKKIKNPDEEEKKVVE